MIYNVNINENQNLQNEQYTDKENESDSSALFEESNSPKYAGKYISITYILVHIIYKVVCSTANTRTANTRTKQIQLISLKFIICISQIICAIIFQILGLIRQLYLC